MFFQFSVFVSLIDEYKNTASTKKIREFYYGV